jgi:PfaD family protein
MNEALLRVREAFFVGLVDGVPVPLAPGSFQMEMEPRGDGPIPLAAYVPAVDPRNLGDPSFCRDYGLRFPYAAGSMAHGIGSEDLVESLARAGMLAFFGSAGMSPARIGQAIDRLQNSLGDRIYGLNLIHSPAEPALEEAVANLYLQKGVRLIEASAYVELTLPLVRFRVHGIAPDGNGGVITPNRIVAKVSRVEVASKFFSPPPDNFLKALLESGEITEEQAALARRIPMARDVTAEGDSGGHTDNRPSITLIPTIIALKDQMQEKYGYAQRLRVGAAGGIATPASAAAAFAMGAAYVMTGSINQACAESGTSGAVREMLAQAQQADTVMAPAADMFEMGVRVQVLKRGTMFAMRAAKLYDYYRNFESFAQIPAPERAVIEKSYFQASFEDIWDGTCRYFRERDEEQVVRGEKDPRHRMALVFRWYLSQASHWAVSGDPARKMDYQVWCGPSMGSFNEWARGSFLEPPGDRKAVTVALNILHGAAVLARVNFLRCQGLDVSGEVKAAPLKESVLNEYLN